MARTRTGVLLLGEWACLGLLVNEAAHGYDVASRLAPDGDVGRVWTLSRPLTYRALDQLGERGLVEPVGQEPGIAGGNRTILAATDRGRSTLQVWLGQPVPHVRDIRGELVLKLVLADLLHVDTRPLLEAQRAVFCPLVEALADAGGPGQRADDPVAVWRYESSTAALRFLDRLLDAQAPRPARRGRRTITPGRGRPASGTTRPNPR
jgi:DNA-binding PadR family transcriptional regulator